MPICNVRLPGSASAIRIEIAVADLQTYAALEAVLKEGVPEFRRHSASWKLKDEHAGLLSFPLADHAKVLEILCAPLNLRDVFVETQIQTAAHYNVVTRQSESFIAEGEKQPARLLFCEFIDNSISALLRWALFHRKNGRLPKLPAIEIHLFYRFIPYRPDDAASNTHKLEHIAIVDDGSGMSKQGLQGWAKMAMPTEQRSEDYAGAKMIEEDNNASGKTAAFQADGRLGIFGRGSKAAGFYYGRKVRVVTRPDLGVSGEGMTAELLLDEAKMEEAEKSGGNWESNSIRQRGQGERERSGFRDASERSCPPLMRLYKDADAKKHYSLFVISDLHEDKASELPANAVVTAAAELRDMYCAYCDMLAPALNGLCESEGKKPFERAKYGPVDIVVNRWKAPRSDASAEWRQTKYSLRDGTPDSIDFEKQLEDAQMDRQRVHFEKFAIRQSLHEILRGCMRLMAILRRSLHFDEECSVERDSLASF